MGNKCSLLSEKIETMQYNYSMFWVRISIADDCLVGICFCCWMLNVCKNRQKAAYFKIKLDDWGMR